MFPIVRVSDEVLSTCKDVPSGPVLTGSSSYFADGLPVARISDETVPGPIITGSESMFVDGLPVCRIIDEVVCGIILTASPTQFST